MTDSRQLYVLCDTNAAARDAHLFRKKGGPQLIAMLRAGKAKLLMPDVLRYEYITQFALAGDDALQRTIKELDRLKTLWGYDIRELLPVPRFGEAAAKEILAQLEDILHVIPTTQELKIAAGDRSLTGVRPTSKTDHGYKDCLIWESILTLPRGSEVILLSRDEAAFFEAGVLAPVLAQEANERGLLLTALSTTKNPTLDPLIDLLKARFSEFASLAPTDLPMGQHPLIQAHTQSERLAPMLPKGLAPEELRPAEVSSGELEQLLSEQTRAFALVDIKALGFVSYLMSTKKQTAINLLTQSGVAAAVAKNALERLALSGLIRDIGHNYLAVEGRLAEAAALMVEPEMIKLTGLGD